LKQHNRETGEGKMRERLTERDRTTEEEKWAMVDGDGGRRKWLGRRLLYPLFVFFLLIIFFRCFDLGMDCGSDEF
jgi:hypothetical protein